MQIGKRVYANEDDVQVRKKTMSESMPVNLNLRKLNDKLGKHG